MSEDKKDLEAFVKERFGTEQSEPEGVTKVRERQEALIAKAERLRVWHKWNQQEHPEITTQDAKGKQGWFPIIREDCGLSVGDVAEITGTSPSAVASYEAGKQSFASAAYEHLLDSMKAALERQ